MFCAVIRLSLVVDAVPSSGSLSHVVTFKPTPGIAFARRYVIHRCTTSGSASHALIARLCVLRSKFSWLFLCTNGERSTVHSLRFVGRDTTLDAGMPREDAACTAKWVKRLSKRMWCERKWRLATGMEWVRGW